MSNIFGSIPLRPGLATNIKLRFSGSFPQRLLSYSDEGRSHLNELEVNGADKPHLGTTHTEAERSDHRVVSAGKENAGTLFTLFLSMPTV